MIASVPAEVLQIGGLISPLVRVVQRTVLGSHLIEYAPQRARYAGSDASALCSLRALRLPGTGAFQDSQLRRSSGLNFA